MKKAILLFLFLTNIFVAKAQTVTSSCTAHDTIVAKYREDAYRLALRKIYRQNLPYKDSVIIPKTHADTVLKALIAVYNAGNLPARDTVITLLSIHSFPYPEMNSIYISADSTLSWMQQFKQGNLITGNNTIDSLTTKYHLKIDRYNNFSNAFYWQNVVFKTDSSYNLTRLAALFQAIPGVYHSNPNIPFGDGNNILDSVYTTHIELIYSYGWGDCQAGCMHRRFWKFKVYYNCSVEYVGSYGDPFQTTGIWQKKSEPFSIYPNPFTYIIFINGISKPFDYTISNLLGQNLLTGRTTNNQIEKLEQLTPGIYLLTIQVGNEIKTYKVFK